MEGRLIYGWQDLVSIDPNRSDLPLRGHPDEVCFDIYGKATQGGFQTEETRRNPTYTG